jgi:hypothetical protein
MGSSRPDGPAETASLEGVVYSYERSTGDGLIHGESVVFPPQNLAFQPGPRPPIHSPFPAKGSAVSGLPTARGFRFWAGLGDSRIVILRWLPVARAERDQGIVQATE